ncbi:MAG: hypothetical protein AAF487_13995 [Bacteroidota bacterium]
MRKKLAIFSFIIGIIGVFFAIHGFFELKQVLLSIQEMQEQISEDSTLNASIVAGGLKISALFFIFTLTGLICGIVAWIKKESLGKLATFLNVLVILFHMISYINFFTDSSSIGY